MRIVRFTSQERVDLPDMTQVSFLVLGEFRKTIRDLLLGFDVGSTQNFAVRGFAVEPSAAPDTRIRVRMDTGDADRLGTVLLSENYGANVETGQLVGGRDSTGALEGQAQQIIDLTGEPPATYIVEVAFTYGAAVTDNRAFWNPAASEFIASTQTRHSPQWQIQIVGAATGGEWLPLASVVWDGVGPITTAEISDLREFVFEGVTPYDVTAQDSADAFADFDRSATRGDEDVSVNEVYRVLKALGRQVMDIKGQDADGNFNWYARALPPYDPAAATFPVQQTKSLRTIDTVTYTVGDGTTEWGDFNGATGLEECLQHLEDLAANAPMNVDIVMKSKSLTPFTWPVTTAHAIPASVLRLTLDFNLHRMTATHPVTTSAISITGELVVRNLRMVVQVTNNSTIFEATKLVLSNSWVFGDTSSTAEAAVIGGPGSSIRDSLVQGLTQYANPGTASAGTDDVTLETVEAVHSSFFAVQVTEGGGGTDKPMPLHMRNCFVRQNTDHGYGIAAAIDVTNNSHCSISDCHIVFRGEGGHGISAVDASGQFPDRLRISGCRIQHSTNATTTTGSAAIYLNGANESSISDCTIDVAVEGDVGGVIVDGCDRVSIISSKFLGGTVGRPADENSAIYLAAASNGQVTISDCHFLDWVEENCIVNGAVCTFLTITNNQFEECPSCIDLVAAGAAHAVICDNAINITGMLTAIELGGISSGVCNNNTIFFTVGGSVGINAGALGDWACVGNNIFNGTIATAGAVLYGASGGGGPTDLNYVH